jgi:WD40-like Beta Propeller Repeat
MPVAGGQPEPVLVGAGEDTDPEISRDGRKLVYTNTRNSYLVMLTDPATGQTKELRESHTELTAPSFSPRGDKVLFFGFDGEGDDQLFTVNPDGGDFTQVTRVKGEHNIFPHWSADGSAIYFYQGSPTNTFRKVSAHGGASSEVASGWGWVTQFDAREDPEGGRIIYSKLDRGRPVSTMIRDVATGQETAFTMPLMHSRWSADGRFIAGGTLDETLSKETPAKGEVMICPVDGGPCRELTRGFMPHWSGDDSRVYFQRVGNFEDGRELWSVSRDGGDERKVMDLRPLSLAPFYDVSAAGLIVWIQFRRGNSELMLSDFPNP